MASVESYLKFCKICIEEHFNNAQILKKIHADGNLHTEFENDDITIKEISALWEILTERSSKIVTGGGKA